IGLKCYTCFGDDDTQCSKSTLESNNDRYLTECLSEFDRCLETWYREKSLGTLARKQCSSQSDCQREKTM
ncbi:hypothetical protein OS493_038958, partial [Desmophyllum pertusum]